MTPTRRACAVALALVACGTAVTAPTPAQSTAPPAASAPAQIATPVPRSRTEYLVPVTHFASPRDAVAGADLAEVVVPPGWIEDARSLLPRSRVAALPEARLLAWARENRSRIALVTPELVDPSVKSLEIDGRFFWDRGLDLAAYPLRRTASGDGPELDRETFWELVAAGEIVFGRGVQERIERYRDPARPFAKVRHLTRSADLALATLESPLSGERNRYCDDCMTFVGNESYVAGLLDSGLGLLLLANNHIGDAGPRGVLDTVRVLDAARIAHVGAGVDEPAARGSTIVTVRGVRVAFLGYTDVPPRGYAATGSRAGSAFFTHDAESYARVRREVADARAQADLVVVLTHWGIEYEDRPRPWVVDAARAMVEAGAHVVLGSHPHWVQSVAVRKRSYVAYSLGNFVFDQMWSPETRQGSLHRLFFTGATLRSVRILPTLIEDYHQPRVLAPEEPTHLQILERIWRNSSWTE